MWVAFNNINKDKKNMMADSVKVRTGNHRNGRVKKTQKADTLVEEFIRSGMNRKGRMNPTQKADTLVEEFIRSGMNRKGRMNPAQKADTLVEEFIRSGVNRKGRVNPAQKADTLVEEFIRSGVNRKGRMKQVHTADTLVDEFIRSGMNPTQKADTLVEESIRSETSRNVHMNPTQINKQKRKVGKVYGINTNVSHSAVNLRKLSVFKETQNTFPFVSFVWGTMLKVAKGAAPVLKIGGNIFIQGSINAFFPNGVLGLSAAVTAQLGSTLVMSVISAVPYIISKEGGVKKAGKSIGMSFVSTVIMAGATTLTGGPVYGTMLGTIVDGKVRGFLFGTTEKPSLSTGTKPAATPIEKDLNSKSFLLSNRTKIALGFSIPAILTFAFFKPSRMFLSFGRAKVMYKILKEQGYLDAYALAALSVGTGYIVDNTAVRYLKKVAGNVKKLRRKLGSKLRNSELEQIENEAVQEATKRLNAKKLVEMLEPSKFDRAVDTVTEALSMGLRMYVALQTSKFYNNIPETATPDEFSRKVSDFTDDISSPEQQKVLEKAMNDIKGLTPMNPTSNLKAMNDIKGNTNLDQSMVGGVQDVANKQFQKAISGGPINPTSNLKAMNDIKGNTNLDQSMIGGSMDLANKQFKNAMSGRPMNPTSNKKAMEDIMGLTKEDQSMIGGAMDLANKQFKNAMSGRPMNPTSNKKAMEDIMGLTKEDQSMIGGAMDLANKQFKNAMLGRPTNPTSNKKAMDAIMGVTKEDQSMIGGAMERAISRRNAKQTTQNEWNTMDIQSTISGSAIAFDPDLVEAISKFNEAHPDLSSNLAPLGNFYGLGYHALPSVGVLPKAYSEAIALYRAVYVYRRAGDFVAGGTNPVEQMANTVFENVVNEDVQQAIHSTMKSLGSASDSIEEYLKPVTDSAQFNVWEEAFTLTGFNPLRGRMSVLGNVGLGKGVSNLVSSILPDFIK
jgi:hypothetical protein